MKWNLAIGVSFPDSLRRHADQLLDFVVALAAFVQQQLVFFPSVAHEKQLWRCLENRQDRVVPLVQEVERVQEQSLLILIPKFLGFDLLKCFEQPDFGRHYLGGLGLGIQNFALLEVRVE